MSSNPLVPQGNLNRLAASVIVPNNSALNVTPGFLGKRQISVAFEGGSTLYIDTQTGAVTSPEPYMKVTISIDLLKTQYVSGLWRAAMEQYAPLGPLTVRPDSLIFPNYYFHNCSIQGVRELSFAGTDASYMVTVGGYYLINQNLYNLV